MANREPGRLDRAFFAGSTAEVARALLGCVIWTRFEEGETAGKIVETEGYLGPDDLASHAARLRAGRAAMERPPGFAYVYRSYGVHAMLNVVTEPAGHHGAVLIRALEPVSGQALMARRRGTDVQQLLCAGPGRLAQALGIRLEHDGVDLVSSDCLGISQGVPPWSVYESGRIGISRGQAASLRFFDPESQYVSAHRRGTPVALPAENRW